jgi:hypothetical protein
MNLFNIYTLFYLKMPSTARIVMLNDRMITKDQIRKIVGGSSPSLIPNIIMALAWKD